MWCGMPNHGQVVGCHSNSLRHGHGRGVKAHDAVAYMCNDCHSLLDGRVGNITRDEKEYLFLDAAYNTWVWLMQSGYLVCDPSHTKRG